MKRVFETDRKDGEVSVVFLDDQEIQKLNKEYRGIDRPTDVLSFALNEGEFPDPQPSFWGDIVISVETAVRQAEAACLSFETEITRLLIHGGLHLMGYDHEGSKNAAEKMQRLEIKILSDLS